MKTITYTNDLGLKYVAQIDDLVEKIALAGESLYCVFVSSRVRDNGQGQTLGFIGDIEACLSYVFMFSIGVGQVNAFPVGGPNWIFVDKYNVDRGSYDTLDIMPLSRAYSHERLCQVMAEDLAYVAGNIMIVRKRCKINEK